MILGVALIMWCYVDDLTLRCAPASIGCAVGVVEEELAKFNIELQRAKCKVHVPSVVSDDTATWPNGLEQAKKHGLEVSFKGIELLGTEAAAHFSTALGGAEGQQQTVCGESSALARRAAEAIELANACVELARAAPPDGGLQPAWALARCVASHALDFDMRVLPSSAVLPYAQSVSDAVWLVAEAALDCALPERIRQQMLLPCDLGGMAWYDPVEATPLARAADLLENGDRLRSALLDRRPNGTSCRGCRARWRRPPTCSASRDTEARGAARCA